MPFGSTVTLNVTVPANSTSFQSRFPSTFDATVLIYPQWPLWTLDSLRMASIWTSGSSSSMLPSLLTTRRSKWYHLPMEASTLQVWDISSSSLMGVSSNAACLNPPTDRCLVVPSVGQRVMIGTGAGPPVNRGAIAKSVFVYSYAFSSSLYSCSLNSIIVQQSEDVRPDHGEGAALGP
jgi:hypothetical protein